MKGRMGLVHGSGNVFRDLKHPNADVEQLKAILAAEIIKTLDREDMTHEQAQARTGVAASDFSRIRKVRLDRFTVDRLMNVMNRLGNRVEVKVKVRRDGREAPPAATRNACLVPAMARDGRAALPDRTYSTRPTD